MNLQSILSFNKMITPSIITVIYYILLATVILGGLITISAGVRDAVRRQRYDLYRFSCPVP